MANERWPDHSRRQQLAAYLDLYIVAGLRRDACQADGTAQRGRKAAARHLSLSDAIHDDLLVRPQHAAIFENQADEFARHSPATLGFQGVAADESGRIYVVDALMHVMQVFDRGGQLLLSVGTQGQGKGELLHGRSLLAVGSLRDLLWAAR